MSVQSRKHRGYATQRMVAEWFAKRGWPFAESTGAGRQGVDVTGMPGLSVEVKAVPGDVTGALAQAHRNRGQGVPFVAWRPNGYGPERIASWPVIMRLDDFTNLLHSAGYGTPEIPEPEHEQGDVPDDGRNDDPWSVHELVRDVYNNHGQDPPQPVVVPCPREPDCELAGKHTHLDYP